MRKNENVIRAVILNFVFEIYEETYLAASECNNSNVM